MRGLAEFVLRHRRWVMAFWGVVLVAGIALAGKTTSRLTVDFSLPGQPGTETANQIKATFGNGGDTSPYLVTVTLPRRPAGERQRGGRRERVRAGRGDACPNVRVHRRGEHRRHARSAPSDGRTAYAIVFYRFNPSPTAKLQTDAIRAAATARRAAGRDDRRDRRGRARRRRLQRRPGRARRDAARARWAR